jgi:hypothetical protein
MIKAHSAIWFAKFGITCALLLTCCWAAPRVFTNLPQFPPTTTDQQQVIVFDRYFRLPILDVALVGSSLSYRLKEEFFERGNVRNVATPGGSPLTGLAIIGAAPAIRPRVIAVETNILNRGIDESLYQKFRNGKRSQNILPPLRTLAAYYQGALDDALTLSKTERRSILERPAAASEVPQDVGTVVGEWNKQSYDETLLKDAKTLNALVKNLEDQGVTICFFEMPYTPVLNRTRYATTVRKVLDEVFGLNNSRWLTLEYPDDEMRWTGDGVHLDERSALIFASVLDKAVSRKFTTAR